MGTTIVRGFYPVPPAPAIPGLVHLPKVRLSEGAGSMRGRTRLREKPTKRALPMWSTVGWLTLLCGIFIALLISLSIGGMG
jgi:hypothetical protein